MPESLVERTALEAALAGAGEPVLWLTPETASPERLLSDVVDGAVVVAAGTLEVLPDFAATVETLIELAGERGVTVVLVVPNHAYAAASAQSRTVWDAGAFAELRSLLPDEHVVWHEVALRGSALVPAERDGALALEVPVSVDGEVVPARFVAAFGPAARALAAACVVAPADLAAERAARAALESELALLRAKVAALEAPNT
jgi:hypothetical protein